jgi:uncharacterized RDD family membrane protein YckC
MFLLLYKKMTIQHSENQPLIRKAITKINSLLYPRKKQNFFAEDPDIIHNNKRYRLASMHRRVLSSGLDLIISSIITIPLGSLLANLYNVKTLDKMMLNPQLMIEDIDIADVLKILWDSGILFNMLLIQFIIFCLIGVYMVLFWVKKGTTIGKMICKCQVVDAKTLEKISLKQGIIRFMMIPFSILPLMIGLFMINWNNKRQSLHDKIAKTIVIYPEKA